MAPAKRGSNLIRTRGCTCVLGSARDDDVSEFFRLKNKVSNKLYYDLLFEKAVNPGSLEFSLTKKQIPI